MAVGDTNLVGARRIAVNTAISYGRSVLALAFGLFSSRWILAALGQTDFGLYGLVGSLVAAVSFVNLVLSSASSRFFAVTMGEGDRESVKSWFNVSVAVHFAFAIVVVVLGLPLGEWAIDHWLVVPETRIQACRYVFRLSIVGTVAGLVVVPYSAMFTARQRFGELAVYSLAGSAMTCMAAWFLLGMTGDRLVSFAVIVCAFSCLMSLLQAVRARMRFKECRLMPSLMVDWRKIREIVSYSGWRLLGTLGWLAQKHGCAIAANLAFGPRANAAYSVAGQVTVHASALTNSMSSATTPALATSLGTGDGEKTGAMVLSSCRFMGALAALVGIPLFLEMDGVLGIWLGAPPDGASSLASLMVAAMVVDSATSGLAAGLSAHRNIGAWQTFAFIILAMSCPVAWLCFKTGHGLSSVGLVCVVVAFAQGIVRLCFARRLLDIALFVWLRGVGVPFCVVVAVSCIAAIGIRLVLPEGIWRIAAVTATSATVTCMVSYMVLFSEKERAVLWQKVFRRRR